MQKPTPLDTGHEDEAGSHAISQQMQHNLPVDHIQQQSYHPVGQFSQLEQRQGYLHASTVSLEGFVSTLNLDDEQSTQLRNTISSASSVLQVSIIHISMYNEQDFNLLHKVSRLCRKHPDSTIYLAYGLALLDQSCWSLLGILGCDRRRTLASYLQQQHASLQEDPSLGLSNLPLTLQGRRSSAPNALSPCSPGHSSTCPSSADPKDRLPAKGRCFCPAVDCAHKLDGFTKWGYLLNHVETKHSSMMDESDWEDRVEFRGPGEEPPRKRRSRKRPATPGTPEGRAQKTDAWVLGTDRHIPNGSYSPGTLIDDLGESSPLEQQTSTSSYQGARVVPPVNIIPPDASLQIPPMTNPTYPVDTWMPHAPTGPQQFTQTNRRLFAEFPRNDFDLAYGFHFGQPPEFGYQPTSDQQG